MAIYGEYGGPIKGYLGTETIAAPNGSNISTTITHSEVSGAQSSKSMTLIITTSANTFIELNSASTVNSFLLTSSDVLIAKISSGNVLGAWGSGAEATVTVRKVIS